MSTPEIPVPDEILAAYNRLKESRVQKARWEQTEQDARHQILTYLGYQPDDPKPPSCIVRGGDGRPAFEVRGGYRRGVDTKYLKAEHPGIYAECEKKTPTITIRAPKGGNDGEPE